MQPQIASWAKVEETRQMWAAWRTEFFGNVRITFIVLLGIAIYVFISDHQLQIETAATRDVHRVLNHVTLSDKLKKNAMAYQSGVDSIAQPAQIQTSQQ
jgi:hypothetical protein